MSGAGRRTVKATNHPVAAAAQPPAADKRLPISDCVLLIRLQKQSRNHCSPRGKRNQPVQAGAGGAAADNAREDALSFLVKEKKRKESVAAEPAPPAKRDHPPRCPIGEACNQFSKLKIRLQSNTAIKSEK